PAYVDNVAADDPRVRLLPKNPTPGMFNNFNHLVQNSCGDAFCILADDDRLCPDFVSTMISPLERDAAVGAVFADHWNIDEYGNRMEERTERNSRHFGRNEISNGVVVDALKYAIRQSLCTMFALYRSSVFHDELFDPSCGGAADVDFAIRATQRTKLFYV